MSDTNSHRPLFVEISCPCKWKTRIELPDVRPNDPKWDERHKEIGLRALADARKHLQSRACALGVFRGGSV